MGCDPSRVAPTGHEKARSGQAAALATTAAALVSAPGRFIPSSCWESSRPVGATETRASQTTPVRSTFLVAWKRALPPARLVWLFLLILGAYSSVYLGGLGISSLVLLPLIAVAVDLVFQRVRFERLRFPDAAIATGLFVALLLPPVVPVLLSGMAVLAAISIKHVLRSHGRPWFNPAAAGVLLGAVVFSVSPAWWVAVGPSAIYLPTALGLVLLGLKGSRWRLPAMFLATYGLVAGIQHAAVGATTDPRILLLQALDPTTLFFAFFMVPEPRSAPSSPPGQVLYGGVVGILSALAPIAFPTVGLLVALLGGNLIARGLDRLVSPSTTDITLSRPRTARSRAKPRRGQPSVLRWSVPRRVLAGLVVLVAVLVVASAGSSMRPAVLPPGGSGRGGTTLAGCTHDNPAIPASTLSQLHAMLGPSVIRSYNASSGVVVFYDPVNHVTVTETDLFEDYGYAEFNGDDFAVSGCST